MPKEVVRWQAKDGTLFVVRKECEAYERNETLVEEITDLLSDRILCNQKDCRDAVETILTKYIIVKRADPPGSAED